MAKNSWLSVLSSRLRHRLVGVALVFWTAIIFICLTWRFRGSPSNGGIPPIPKRIWQLWIGSTKQPPQDWRESLNTWVDLNPEYDHQYAIMNHSSAEAYVQEAFKHRPDVVDAFARANETIRKADFLRYLLLLEQGGVYTDLDTRCVEPVQDWIPPQYSNHTGLVIGIEIDDYLEGNYDLDKPYIQLCQWTIMARPHHPVMEKVVDSVIARLGSWDEEDVEEITGPHVFTEAVFESLAEFSGRENEMLRYDVSALKEPYHIGDVLILPINAFGSGQLHSGSQEPDDCDPLAVHAFAGSWRPEKQTQ